MADRTRLLVAGLLGLSLLLLAGLVQTGALVPPLDKSISSAVLGLRSAASDWIVIVVTLFGDGLALTLIGVALVGVLALRAAWWPAAGCAVIFLSTPYIVKMIKLLVGRERPVSDLYSGVESFSFPSGHMTNSMVIYGALALLAARALSGAPRILAVTVLVWLIASIGISRVYLGAHWPSDVVAAFCLAGIMLLAIDWSFSKVDRAMSLSKSFVLVSAFTLCVWAVYGFMTFEVAVDHYSLDVSPEGTIDVVPEP